MANRKFYISLLLNILLLFTFKVPVNCDLYILNAMEVDHGKSNVANVITVAGTNELHRRMVVEEFVLVADNTVKG